MRLEIPGVARARDALTTTALSGATIDERRGDAARGLTPRPRFGRVYNSQRPAASGQRPAASGQRPAASGQRPAASGQRPAASGQRPAASGQRPAASGQRPAASGMTCARREAGAQRPAPPAGSSSQPDPRPGRARARRSLFLPALALLFGACSLFTVAPAEASHVLPTPTNLQAQAGNTQVTLTWTKGHNNLGFDVAHGEHPSGSLSTQTVHSTANETVTITGLSNGTTYRFRVRANGHSGHTESAWTSFVTATPSAEAQADVTVTLSASPNPVTEGSLVTVTATLSAPTLGAVSFPLLVTPGSAEAGDYSTGGQSSIDFVSADNSSSSISISARQDADANDETFTVALDTANLPSGYVAGSPSSVEITIADDDAPPTVTPSAPPSTDAPLSALAATSSTSATGTFTSLALTPSDRHVLHGVGGEHGVAREAEPHGERFGRDGEGGQAWDEARRGETVVGHRHERRHRALRGRERHRRGGHRPGRDDDLDLYGEGDAGGGRGRGDALGVASPRWRRARRRLSRCGCRSRCRCRSGRMCASRCW